MKKPLVVEPEAEQDLAEAFAWYEDQREGLGLAPAAEVVPLVVANLNIRYHPNCSRA